MSEFMLDIESLPSEVTLLPKGEYDLEVKAYNTYDGREGSKIHSFQFTVVNNPEHEGKILFDSFFSNDPNSMLKLRNLIASTGRELKGNIVLSELEGEKVSALIIEGKRKDKDLDEKVPTNIIKQYLVK